MCGVGNLPRQAPERFALTAGSTQDLPRNVPVAIEICLAEGKPAAQRQNCLREPVSQGFWSRPVGQPGRLQRPIWISLSTAREAGSREPAGQPGRLQRPLCAAREAGSRDPIGQPGRLQGASCATRGLGQCILRASCRLPGHCRARGAERPGCLRCARPLAPALPCPESGLRHARAPVSDGALASV